MKISSAYLIKQNGLSYLLQEEGDKDFASRLNEEFGFVKDYVPHMWDIPKNKTKDVVNWFVTKTPSLKKRYTTF